jgi:hypothetical protein
VKDTALNIGPFSPIEGYFMQTDEMKQIRKGSYIRLTLQEVLNHVSTGIALSSSAAARQQI